MKKNFLVAILSLAIIATLFSASACKPGIGNIYADIEVNSVVYDMGEQEVDVAFEKGNTSSTFKQTISKENIQLTDALDGLVVSDVKYIDEMHIKLSLTGTAKNRADGHTVGKITVTSAGKNGDGDSVAYVTVDRPAVSTLGFIKSSATTKDGITTYFFTGNMIIDAGRFIESAIPEKISFADGITGNLSVEYNEDGSLMIKVDNCNSETPGIVIGKEATTFGKEVILPLGSFVNF